MIGFAVRKRTFSVKKPFPVRDGFTGGVGRTHCRSSCSLPHPTTVDPLLLMLIHLFVGLLHDRPLLLVGHGDPDQPLSRGNSRVERLPLLLPLVVVRVHCRWVAGLVSSRFRPPGQLLIPDVVLQSSLRGKSKHNTDLGDDTVDPFRIILRYMRNR